MIISSQQNPIFKKIRSLTTSKGIREHGQCLLSGSKVTEEFLHSKAKNNCYWILRSDQRHPPGDKSQSLTLARELFETIDVMGTHHPILCVEVPQISPLTSLNQKRPAFFSSLGDPTNLGAAIRSCLAFGVQQIVLTKEACNPFLPKALRSSSGYSLQMEFFQGPPIREIQDENIYALDMGGEPLTKTKLASNLSFLIGEEGQGLPKNFPGKRVSIKMEKPVESLNAAVATSLFLFHWKTQQEK